MKIIGLMSGTSLDGVDAALLETDGYAIQKVGPGTETPYSREEREVLQNAVDAALTWRFQGAEPAAFEPAIEGLTESHVRAVKTVCAMAGISPTELDAVGFHGQTIIHIPPKPDQLGRTLQIGDGQALADRLGCVVVSDFRSADLKAGGQGAPLAPIYHKLLVETAGLPTPIGLLNIGGVANLTLIGRDGALTAFDTGPGNGLMDAWILEKIGQVMDVDGQMAANGRVHDQTLSDLLAHPHFKIKGPKSLDRWDFSLDHARNLSIEDGLATLSEFTARAISDGIKGVKERPHVLVACGGGRKNPTLLQRIEGATGIPVWPAEAVGWRGDLIEAEAFAVLAARRINDLPISFPGTTGVNFPITGGVVNTPMKL